jgi:hypothetical protein
MLANPAMVSPDKLDKFITIRQERQARLERDTDARLDVVIWEVALITTVGSDEVQRGQLTGLLELMERPNISVQVLPLEAGDQASMCGSFVMFSFGSERSVSTVFVENLTSSQYLEMDQELRGYTLVFDALRSAALSPVLVVPLARARSGDFRHCRPIGCYEAAQNLAHQYRRDR